ncbi:hypothetical protein OB2597_05450 [Pseudooceanicola batsensis HTCC2597]|uniref:TonB C-terminal domain-containing protein n=1 Tax=Pseudooceanicola batsensis (strain ATCC BAA-863 / DSM 15984 / KCTC 12145 / HTCC2597) TaxID=252305 RepID=A3TSS5_PSEBH|nr:TonB family protein [Pseudooceanicola batsensis]EAQ04702.1 hypothetical protein OB2597_05450 [Pseudooceanicola batsensis HTCC2597]
MTRSSRTAKIAALSVAVVAHGAMALALMHREETRMEGASGASEVRLGNAFEDLATGTIAPDAAERETERETPDRIEAAQPDTVARETPPDPVETQAPDAARPATAEPVEAEQPVATERTTAERVPASPPARPDPQTPAIPLTPEGALPLAASQAEATDRAEATPEAPAESVQPAQAPVQSAALAPRPEPLSATRAAPAERITGTTRDTTAPPVSKRPARRPESLETAEPRPAPKPARPARQTAQPSAPGNAAQNARAGQASGQEQAQARSSGSGGRAQEAGNAAASNYPGLVMRKLSRARKPNIRTRGTATVAFSIAANGRLSGARILSSSGSSRVDQAALQVVRSAAPFPRPPSGAQRNFSTQVIWR